MSESFSFNSSHQIYTIINSENKDNIINNQDNNNDNNSKAQWNVFWKQCKNYHNRLQEQSIIFRSNQTIETYLNQQKFRQTYLEDYFIPK